MPTETEIAQNRQQHEKWAEREVKRQEEYADEAIAKLIYTLERGAQDLQRRRTDFQKRGEGKLPTKGTDLLTWLVNDVANICSNLRCDGIVRIAVNLAEAEARVRAFKGSEYNV